MQDTGASAKSLPPELLESFVLRSPALLKAFVTVVIFATAPTCVRAVEWNAVTLGIARLALAAGAMTLMLVWQGKLSRSVMQSWTRQTWTTLVLVGLCFGVHWLLFFMSIKLASAAIGAIGFSTYGIHLLILGWLLGYSQVNWLDGSGVLLAMMGTFLLVPEFTFENEHTVGLTVGILSGFAAALLPLLHQKNAQLDVDLRTWGQFTFALVVFLFFLPATEWKPLSLVDVGLILYLGLGVAWIGHALWVQVTTLLSTTTISLLSYLYLPSSLVVGFLVLGEKLSGKMLLGTVCVLAANALVIASQARRRTLEAKLVETT